LQRNGGNPELLIEGEQEEGDGLSGDSGVQLRHMGWKPMPHATYPVCPSSPTNSGIRKVDAEKYIEKKPKKIISKPHSSNCIVARRGEDPPQPPERSELAEQVDSAKQSQHRRIEVKSSGERRLAESPEGLPGALTHGPDLLPSGSRRAA
jgi:hypothetical protein